MAIADTARRLGGTLLSMLQTRIELAAVELEEESQRFLGYLVMALLSLFLFGLAIVLATLFVVIVFWDSYRLQAVGTLALLFAAGGALVAMKVKASIASKPRMMQASVAEFSKDLELLRGSHE